MGKATRLTNNLYSNVVDILDYAREEAGIEMNGVEIAIDLCEHEILLKKQEHIVDFADLIEKYTTGNWEKYNPDIWGKKEEKGNGHVKYELILWISICDYSREHVGLSVNIKISCVMDFPFGIDSSFGYYDEDIEAFKKVLPKFENVMWQK